MKKAPERRRQKMPNRPDTKRKILDTAEILFATRGYHPTSLRAVTHSAKVNLAAVHYHFGSKQALLEAVIARRLGPLNAERQARLTALPDMADAGTILRAFLEPTLKLRDSGAGARHFLTLVGRAMVEPDESVRSVFLAQMQGLLEQLFARLATALPHLPGQEIFWRLFFALGTVAHTLRMADKFRQPPPGVATDVSTEDLVDMLTRFIAAGMVQQQSGCHRPAAAGESR
jgi:AcrR family transcriptional regulator